MPPPLRVPYTQQFSPKSTPLGQLLGILRKHQGKRTELKNALARAFFGATKDPDGMAGNTVITLQAHGLIDDNGALTEIGSEIVNASTEGESLGLLARNILFALDGVLLIETMREMRQAGTKISLGSLKEELRLRGVEVSDNSSDLSGVLGWLRAAGVLADYAVKEDRYSEIVGSSTATIDALKDLSESQVAFLRAMLALGVTDFTPYPTIARHAEGLYAGQITYDWKRLDRTVLAPLAAAGLIEVRKARKASVDARGGKKASVKPTEKFEREVAERVLAPIYKAAGFRDVRRIRSVPLAQLVADARQNEDNALRGKSLEVLAIRICQLLDLDFFGWRATDETRVAGGEVDAFLHTARLIYSRWQIQCKASDRITVETIAKEVGMAEVTLANVILIVSTGTMTAGARSFRERIVTKTPLNIAVIDGRALDRIVEDPSAITEILRTQAEDTMRAKPTPDHLTKRGSVEGGSPNSEGPST